MRTLILLLLIFGLSCSAFNLRQNPDMNKIKYLYDKDGRICIYHGLNVSNYQKHSEGYLPWQTKEDFARMKDWGFNVVRYLVFWEAIEPTEGIYNEAYIDSTIERLKWLQELDIGVIIDFHQDLYSKKFGGNGFPLWTTNDGGFEFKAKEPWDLNYTAPAVLMSYYNFWSDPDLKKKYIRMMEHTLRKVRSLDNILGVDVMNEPFPGQVCLNFEETVLTNFYKDISDMYENNNFDFKLIFEPVIYTSAGFSSGLEFYSGSKGVYSPHYYDPLCTKGKPYTTTQRRIMEEVVEWKVTEAQKFGAPLIYGEFGIWEGIQGYETYLDNFLSFMDTYSAGWIYYCYDKARNFSILDSAGNERPQLKHLVRIYPMKIAGTDPVYRVNPNLFSLTYKTAKLDSPTVIFIPPSMSGISIFINGAKVAYNNEREFRYVNDSSEKQSIIVRWH